VLAWSAALVDFRLTLRVRRSALAAGPWACHRRSGDGHVAAGNGWSVPYGEQMSAEMIVG